MKGAAIACSVLAAGCVTIPPFGGGAPGSIGDVSAVMDGDGATVTGPGYVLHFDRDHAHFPDSFLVAGHEALAPGTACGQAAGLMGAQIYPAADSAMPLGPTDSATLEITTAGPSVARLTIRWESDLAACGQGVVDSWWTFFPDGRISRFDQLSSSNLRYVTSGCAGCAGDTTYELRNETLYNAATAQTIQGGVTGTTQTPTDQGGDGSINDRLCIGNDAFKLIAVDGPGPGPKLYSQGDSVGVVYVENEATSTITSPVGGYTSSIIPKPPTARCLDLLQIADGYASYVQLHANDDTDGVSVDYDGIAGGFDPGGGFGFVTDPSDVFTFYVTNVDVNYAPAPAGYAIGMQFNGPHASYTVMRGATVLAGDEVRVQNLAIPKNAAILWLRDGIAYGDTITVQGD